jgi:transposase-like protein
MGKQDKERRVYPRKFKAEVAAPAGKHEKPVRQIALDLGINNLALKGEVCCFGKVFVSGHIPFITP